MRWLLYLTGDDELSLSEIRSRTPKSTPRTVPSEDAIRPASTIATCGNCGTMFDRADGGKLCLYCERKVPGGPLGKLIEPRRPELEEERVIPMRRISRG